MNDYKSNSSTSLNVRISLHFSGLTLIEEGTMYQNSIEFHVSFQKVHPYSHGIALDTTEVFFLNFIVTKNRR